MTGRQLIKAICESVQDLDSEIPVNIVFRDLYCCVTQKRRANLITFINGKLGIENSHLDPREPVR